MRLSLSSHRYVGIGLYIMLLLQSSDVSLENRVYLSVLKYPASIKLAMDNFLALTSHSEVNTCCTV